MTSTSLTVGRPAIVTAKQKVGIGLAIFYAVTNLPSPFFSTGGTTGPPMSILVVDTVLAAIALFAGVLAWRGSQIGLRVCAGANILITLTSLPAFFVDVPLWVKVTVALSVVWTVVMVVLMFSGEQRTTPVVD